MLFTTDADIDAGAGGKTTKLTSVCTTVSEIKGAAHTIVSVYYLIIGGGGIIHMLPYFDLVIDANPNSNIIISLGNLLTAIWSIEA